MSEHIEQLDALRDIRNMMERSSRFMSLSGIGGILVGLTGVVGTIIAYYYLGERFSISRDGSYFDPDYDKWGWSLKAFFFTWASCVLGLAICFNLIFTYRRAKRKHYKVWDIASMRSLINFIVPAGTGGIVCLILLVRGLVSILAPMTLIFFGLACINASKYTLEEVRYLGYSELILGLLAMYFTSLGLLFWGLGFGVAILVFGIYLYQKYERFD
jgi:hypothetical protein